MSVGGGRLASDSGAHLHRLPGVHYGFDAKLADGELLLAIALRTSEETLALFRVANGRAEELTKCPLERPSSPCSAATVYACIGSLETVKREGEG